MKQPLKWITSVVLFVFVLLLNGCGFKDIDKRFFVVSIGVDPAEHTEKRFKISLKFAVPSASKEQPNESLIISDEADSISEAVRRIKSKVDKEIDFSHAKVILISEEIVNQKDNSALFYWFTRRRDIQGISWVAIAKPSALEVLKTKPKSEQLPSNSLFLALGRDGSETPYVVPDFLFDFKMRLSERGLDPYMPIIESKKDYFQINKVALFDKHKMIISLDQEEAKMLNFLMGLVNKAVLKAKEDDYHFFVNITKIKSSYKLYTANQEDPYIHVKISLKGTIEETPKEILNQRLPEYEKVVEKRLNKELEALLIKMQKEGVDPVGFGLRYRSRHFNDDDWEEWTKLYPSITFKVSTKVDITDTGLIE